MPTCPRRSVRVGAIGQELCLYIQHAYPPLPPPKVTPADPPPPPHPPRQVCPGEWVYHYVDTAKIGAGHYGPGHHLRFTLSKSANEGAAIAMTRHSML